MRGRVWQLILLLLLPACTSTKELPVSSPSGADGHELQTGRLAQTPPPELYVDITRESGVHFTHFNDASEKRYLPETMGSGAAFFDYDGDGRPDLFLVNGAPLTGSRSHARPCALYRNLDGTHFQDVTIAAGLAKPLYGMGVTVGDFDNDGNTDLFVSALDGDRLYRNRGDRSFEDVTGKIGLTTGGFSTSAAFVDYDRDGYLDLLVGRYVAWRPDKDVLCAPDGVHRTYCTPEVYQGQTNRLYHNLAGRRLVDVTRASGIYNPEGKTLGVAILDQNRDGWPDLAVANDTVRNFLYINNRNGTFREEGVALGLAYGDSGATRGGMGIDVGDVDGDGYDDVVIGNFAQEMSALYRNTAPGFFVDDAAQSGIGMATLMSLAFGSLIVDFDNDGWLDVVFVNGHIEPEIALIHRNQSYAQVPQFFHNEGKGRFKLMRGAKGGVFEIPLVARGLAAADMDGDGDLDLVVTQNGREAILLRNNAPPAAWLRLRFVGRRSNRTGYGVSVRVIAGDKVWTRTLASGRSYLSASEPVLTIGLGKISRVDRLEITWPSGIRQVVPDPPLQRVLTIEESASLTQ